MNIKMFEGNSLLHELLLTTTQKTKLRNAVENNIATYIKHKYIKWSNLEHF